MPDIFLEHDSSSFAPSKCGAAFGDERLRPPSLPRGIVGASANAAKVVRAENELAEFAVDVVLIAWASGTGFMWVGPAPPEKTRQACVTTLRALPCP